MLKFRLLLGHSFDFVLLLTHSVNYIFVTAVLIQFDRLCTLLGRSRQERASVLDFLQKDAYLVQGLWVASSTLLLSSDSRLINARDYIVRHKFN